MPSTEASSSRQSLRQRLFPTPKQNDTPAAPVATPGRSVDEADREQGSLSTTTLSGTHKRALFYRRSINKSSSSDPALSSSTSHSIIKPNTRSTRPKPSFLSRVVHKVVPCVSPPEDVVMGRDVHDPTPKSSDPPPPIALRELVIVPQPDSSTLSTGTLSPHSQDVVPDPSDRSSSPQAAVLPPPSPTDSEVIVPPPPNTHLLPPDVTINVTSGAVQPPGSTGDQIARTLTHDSSEDSDRTSYTDDDIDDRHMHEDEQAEEDRLRRNGGSGIPIGPDGIPKPLLPPISPEHVGRKCLVLDLDETLVHSSFKAIQQADFIVPVEIEYHWHHFHVLKRPGVDNFLKKMGEIYEIVVFTASLSKYADPVLDKLDMHHVVAHRLFRESCFSHKGNYVKDLSQLGRPVADTIILDNSPASYIFHPNNAVPVSSWFNDPHDAELTDLIPFLADLTSVPDVRGILDSAR